VIVWGVGIFVGLIFLLFWVRAVLDAYGRTDLSSAAKAAWTIIMLLVPIIGIVFYYVIRPSDEQLAQG
jgi:hypothetical protein